LSPCSRRLHAGGDESADGTATTSLSAEEYVERADELCQRIATDVVELGLQEQAQEILSGGGTTEEKLNVIAGLLDQQLQLVSDFRRDIEALGRPAAGRADVDQFLDKTRSAEDELERGIDAAQDGDEDEFADAMQSYADFSTESAAIARDSELNFEICGSGA
jgi:hypothetical protein